MIILNKNENWNVNSNVAAITATWLFIAQKLDYASNDYP